MAAGFNHTCLVVCVWGSNRADLWTDCFVPDGPGKTAVHLRRGVSSPALLLETITNRIKTNFQLQSCVEEPCCLSVVGLCVAECVPVFVQWKCCVRKTLDLCWLCCGLHTGSLFCPERPVQRDLRWVNGAFSGLQVFFNIILLFIKNWSWSTYSSFKGLVHTNKIITYMFHWSHTGAINPLCPHLTTAKCLCHFFGRK